MQRPAACRLSPPATKKPTLRRKEGKQGKSKLYQSRPLVQFLTAKVPPPLAGIEWVSTKPSLPTTLPSAKISSPRRLGLLPDRSHLDNTSGTFWHRVLRQKACRPPPPRPVAPVSCNQCNPMVKFGASVRNLLPLTHGPPPNAWARGHAEALNFCLYRTAITARRRYDALSRLGDKETAL